MPDQRSWGQKLRAVFSGVRGLVIAGIIGGTVALGGYNQLVLIVEANELAQQNSEAISNLRSSDQDLNMQLRDMISTLESIKENQRFIICSEYVNSEYGRESNQCDDFELDMSDLNG